MVASGMGKDFYELNSGLPQGGIHRSLNEVIPQFALQ